MCILETQLAPLQAVFGTTCISLCFEQVHILKSFELCNYRSRLPSISGTRTSQHPEIKDQSKTAGSQVIALDSSLRSLTYEEVRLSYF